MIISIVRPWSPQEVNTKVWFPVKYCGTKRINTYSSIWFNHESFQYNQKYQPVKNQGQSTRIQESKKGVSENVRVSKISTRLEPL